MPVGVGVGRNVIFEHLDAVAPQSHSNNLGRYLKVRTTLLKLPLCVANRF